MANIRKGAALRSDILQIAALLLALYIGYVLLMRPDGLDALQRQVAGLESWRACVSVVNRSARSAGKVPNYDGCTDAGRQ